MSARASHQLGDGARDRVRTPLATACGARAVDLPDIDVLLKTMPVDLPANFQMPAFLPLDVSNKTLEVRRRPTGVIAGHTRSWRHATVSHDRTGDCKCAAKACRPKG